LRAHRYAVGITHVDTGRLKNSHFPSVQAAGNQVYGVVGTNVYYAIYEHNRGGEHAFYKRTAKEEGPAIVAEMEAGIEGIIREANA
jgi:phage gpG-like protein